MLESGLSLQAIRRAVACLRRHRPDLARPLANLTLVTDGKRIFTLTDNPHRVVDITAGGQITISVPVASIAREVKDRVTEISAPRQVTVRVRGKPYRAILQPDLEAGGYTIEVPDLSGCITEANDVPEARRMLRDAISLWLDAQEDRREQDRRRAAK